ncbi:MAG: patatin-like phospholipase family protein [Kiritimatiellae bacterium]|nr:patatin-like phospholipase family protein [Kiritimatiellia bacterium]
MPDTPKASTILPPGAVVGLALGSGGGRGLAHLGVLRYLAETGIRPAFVAGTSAGSIVGATCACGRTEDLIDIAENADWRFMTKIFGEVGLHRSGLFTGRHVERFLRTFLPATIEELQLPFAAVATDYRRTREVVIDKGDLIEAIRASISIPGVFTPVRRGGRYLVDGALVNPVPVSVVRKMGATFVIGVDVNLAPGRGISDTPGKKSKGATPFDRSMRRLQERFDEIAAASPRAAAALESAKEFLAQYRNAPTLIEVLTQTTRLAENQMTQARLAAAPPDILVQPAVGDVATLDFTNARACIRAGYEAAKAALAQVRTDA